MWKDEHGKQYSSDDDHDERKKIWLEKHNYINEHNARQTSFQLSHNKYSDLTPNEYLKLLKGFNSSQHAPNPNNLEFSLQATNLPESIDWRQKGYVNPIQDQGQCGACYAFSACASIEGQYMKINEKLVKLSEQNLVDCSSKYGNNGGDGGTMNNCFMYVKENGGIETEQSYPYQCKAGSCNYNSKNSATKITGYVDIPKGDELALTAAIAQIGPISVGIDASQHSFQFYKSGIYYDEKCSAEHIDHAVVIVGYGTDESGQDYYIVRNSWGTSWVI